MAGWRMRRREFLNLSSLTALAVSWPAFAKDLPIVAVLVPGPEKNAAPASMPPRSSAARSRRSPDRAGQQVCAGPQPQDGEIPRCSGAGPAADGGRRGHRIEAKTRCFVDELLFT